MRRPIRCLYHEKIAGHWLRRLRGESLDTVDVASVKHGRVGSLHEELGRSQHMPSVESLDLRIVNHQLLVDLERVKI